MTLRPRSWAPRSWAPPPLSRLELHRRPLTRLPLSPVAAARSWSTATLARSRRNAMVALTALAERRAEREDAEAFLAAVVPAPRRAADGS